MTVATKEQVAEFVALFHLLVSEEFCIHMTLRDWFAGQVISSLVEHCGRGDADLLAKYSYELADGMLAEREKEKSDEC